MALAENGALRASGAAVAVLFTATIFLSASLLFFVQPLFALLALPQIGGAPAVWTTAMLFFQTVLILGYLYAHLMMRHVPSGWQMPIHIALWAAALLFLPLAVPAGWRFDPEGSVALQTLLLFAGGVGLPFLFLSANAPLIQSWYLRSGGPSAHDPYFLYGASNLGSLIALLAFPLVAQPLFGASAIGIGWALGFVALGGFLAVTGWQASRRPVPEVPLPRATATAAPPPAEGAPGLRRVVWWAFLAFLPSSLMLVVTTKISTDLGAVPLVWVVPLSLYLLTFVITFTNRPWLPPALLRPGFVIGLLAMVAVFAGLFGRALTWTTALVMVAAFFVMALHAHRRLYEARPEGRHLTGFYLTMSIGGALGGLFNSIIAPLLFIDLYEGIVTLVLAGLLLMGIRTRIGAVLTASRARMAGLAAGALAMAVVVTLGLALQHGFGWAASVAGGLGAGAALGLWLLYPTPVLILVVMVTLGVDAMLRHADALYRDRSFFGTHRVSERAGLHVYSNGTTVHGVQRVADLGAERPEPLSYYHRNAPMAQVLTSSRADAAETVGIVGLGIGALACYRQPQQSWHLYEIDPVVDRLARTPELFSFVTACTPDAPTHLGDARMVLAGQEDLAFDILVIDAYSSDAVPVHLTTTEAMELYLDRLAPGGILVYHISNRYYDIDRPLGRSAAELGLAAMRQRFAGGEDRAEEPAVHVVMLARDAADFAELAADPRWEVLEDDGGRLWTDDHADLLSILR